MAETGIETTPAAKFDFTGYAMALTGAALFSTKGVFIKLAYQAGIGTEGIIALRMIVAVPVYLVIGAYLLARNPDLRKSLTPGTIAGAAAVGSLGYYVASYLDFAGLSFVTAQYERLVLFTYPFFTLALGVLFFGDRMNWRTVPGLVLSYSGLIVIFSWNLVANPDGLFTGTMLVLGSAVVFALYQHLARGRMRTMGSRMFTCIGMSAAGLIAITHNSVVNGVESFGGFSSEVWMYGLALGILGTVLPSFVLNGAIHRIGARATSATGSLGPVMTIAMAVPILGEAFTIYHAIGTAMVIAGMMIFGRAEHKG